MVMSVDRKGFYDWIIQRITALIIGLYAIYLFAYFMVVHPDYNRWHALFHNPIMVILSMIVLVSIVWHAWIGLWTVLTDYVTFRPLRLLCETVVILLLASYFAWFLVILWG